MPQVIFLFIFLLLEWYFFRSIKVILFPYSFFTNNKKWVYIIYWSATFLSLSGILFYMFFSSTARKFSTDYPAFSFIFGYFFLVFLSKVIGCIFFLVDDLKTIISFFINKSFSLFQSNHGNTITSRHLVSRTQFLQWLGVGLSSFVLGSLSWGLLNKYRYKIYKKKVAIKDLPKSFEGLKIVQISDIHSGSLKDIEAVRKGVEMIMKLKADVIFFTGDLVNNVEHEALPLLSTLSSIKAPLGVFSILGNHDYGDYVRWESKERKKKNLETLKQHHATMGWNLLLNDSTTIEKDNQKIGIVGVENWSSFGRFPKYGNLEKAYKKCEPCHCKILLSHDPTHWRKEVLNQKKDIALTLSGHTHGMQYGVEIPGFKWSPVQYFYKEWAGLYSEANQHLYVNRGFGFIGYPGRFGILPEITLLELTKA